MKIKTKLTGNTDPPKHAAGLSAVWQNRVSIISGPAYRMLTPNEHGQLRRLKDSLGVERSTQMIQYAIQNWETFARKATQNEGTEPFPNNPHVGFLLKYHPTALILMLDEKKKAAEGQAMKEAQANVAKALEQLNSKPNPVTPIRLTQEQLNAFFNIGDPANEAWADKVTEKHGQWRPDEKGIPCGIELKPAD